MRKWSWLLVLLLSLTSCTTHYYSTQEEELGYEVIVGKEDEVLEAVYEAIEKRFPDTSITILAGKTGYSFYHQPLLDRTNFDFVLNKVEVVIDGNTIEGFVYSIDTHGTQFFADSRYVNPLVEEFKSTLMKRNIMLTKAASITFAK